MDTLDIFERRGYVNYKVHVFNKHLKTTDLNLCHSLVISYCLIH